MTRTRGDRAKVQAITVRLNVRRWWDSLDAWDQILIGAVLVCIFELAFLRAAYPYLERMVVA